MSELTDSQAFRLTLTRPVESRRPDELTLIAEAADRQLDGPTLAEAWRVLDRVAPIVLEHARSWPVRHAVAGTLACSAWIVLTPRKLSLEHHVLWALDAARKARLDERALLRLLTRFAYSRGEMARARQWIQRGERAGDDSDELLRHCLHVAVRTGSYDEADALLQRFRARNVWTDWERMHLGLLHTKRGRRPEAHRLFETLLVEAQRDNRRLTAGRLEFLLGELALANGHFEEVLVRIASSTANMAPIEPPTLMLIAATRRAQACFELGRLDESRTHGEAAWDLAMDLGNAEGALEAAMVRYQIAGATNEPQAVWAQRIRTWIPVGTRAEVVARAATLLEGISSAPQVAEDGAWFEVGGVRTDLRRRRAVSRVLAALAAARGRPVGADALFSAGWPKERIHIESARRRVYTAIWTLRRAGLAPFLSNAGDGYALQAPDAPQ